jgi:adenylate cyclase
MPGEGWLEKVLETRIGALMPSIAVLPYRSSAGPEFARAMTYAVTSALMSIAELHVVSASSTVRLWTGMSPRALAASRVGARYLLEGRIVVDGRQGVLFTHELYDLEAGTVRNLEPVDAHLSHLHEFYELIVTRIMSSVLPSLGDRAVGAALARLRHNVCARMAVLEAIVAINELTPAAHARAERLLRAAEEQDPDCAFARAWHARLLSIRLGQGWAADRRQTATEALRIAEAAVELDGRNALALATAGHLRSYLLRDYEGGLELLDSALNSCVNEPFAWLFSGVSLAYTGNAKAGARRASYALALSPHDGCAYMFDNFTGLCHYADGDYEEACRLARRSLLANPGYSTTYKLLAAALVGSGRISEARVIGARLLRIEPGYPQLAEQTVPFSSPQQRELFLTQLEAAGVLDRRSRRTRQPPEAAE